MSSKPRHDGEAWLNADEEAVNRAVLLLTMPEVLNARSATVASLFGPFRGLSDNWRLRLRRLVEAGQLYTSPEMKDLVIALIQDGTLDTATGFAVNSDWWSVLVHDKHPSAGIHCQGPGARGLIDN